MKNKNEASDELKIDQLLSERAFLDYCNFDYSHHSKLNIDSTFLRAAEKDNFLFPLTEIKEKTQENGEEKEISVKYYSPHQIYIVAALSKNQVSEGLLWTNENLDFYKQQGFRMVNWGWSGYAFNITLGKEGSKLQDGDIFELCNDFYNFLLLLHSFEQKKDYFGLKSRHFTVAPSLDFDFSTLKPAKLEQFKLSVSKLNAIRHQLAYIATQIDPLENWYYYIHRHPQWRKDLFKGEALLAQELYIICDLLSEILEAVDNKKQPQIFELIYGQHKIYPYLIPQIEYIHGTDVKSMWTAIDKFREWSKQDDNKDFVEKETLQRLGEFEKELKEFEDKYGARSFISNGIREVEIEENIKIEDLDTKTRQYVDQITKQAKEQLSENEQRFLSPRDDELRERVKKGEITLEQAEKEDYDYFLKEEIFQAIEYRLSSLKRELWAILDIVQKQISGKSSEAWEKTNSFDSHFWFQRREELKNLSREDQLRLHKKEYQKNYKEAQYWTQKRDKFGEIEFEIDLLFCDVCRQKPVIVHQSHNDQKISNNSICDDCIKNTKDPKKIKQAELKCDYCGYRLYKYAYQNRLNDLLFNQAPADIDVELEYGRLQVRIKCKSCGEVNRRWIDWGWIA